RESPRRRSAQAEPGLLTRLGLALIRDPREVFNNAAGAGRLTVEPVTVQAASLWIVCNGWRAAVPKTPAGCRMPIDECLVFADHWSRAFVAAPAATTRGPPG